MVPQGYSQGFLTSIQYPSSMEPAEVSSEYASDGSDGLGAGMVPRCLRGYGYFYDDWLNDHGEILADAFRDLRDRFARTGALLLLNTATLEDFCRFVYRHTEPRDFPPTC